MKSENPILNSPYDAPLYHYATDLDGALDYSNVIEGRRIFTPDTQVIPIRQTGQKELLEVNDFEATYGSYLINLVRSEVGKWRAEGYPNTTRVTKELLTYWFENPERHAHLKLFFAQREAIETTVWLNEVANKSNPGQYILNLLEAGRKETGNLPRTAFKMATGTGKTVVMAALILYHFLNRQEYRNDTRFADNFLIIAPGITIRDRLSVLFVDVKNLHSNEVHDYYHQRGLVPPCWRKVLPALNAKIIITNYHGFEPRTLQGNKRSPFDGKLDAAGEKQEIKEDYNQVLRRAIGKLKPGSRLLMINDEAHHCYKPIGKGKKTEGEDTAEENARAAVWFTGIEEISRRFKVDHIYDLSATPYYLTGSGYPAYQLFGWVVSDFGLIEAIESGLVKIPFLPESDNTQELDMPVLRNLYEHVKEGLPKKGQKAEKKAAKEKGGTILETPPKLPPTLTAALQQFYKHYEADFEKTRELFDAPPVFIVVCNNTSVSKEVYKWIAGYERSVDKNGNTVAVGGALPLFSNYNEQTNRPLEKSPTLLIDSDALENSNQVNDDFKTVFASEIELFKRDYARIHGSGSAETITEAEILREVVNTVGKPGTLGSHIRCIVSVSMLTEGWDANTVTHIVGVRAFGSQLLCEQVAGRALRRKKYILQGYDKDGRPTDDKRRIKTWKFPPEYAHIIGVPFKMFKGGETVTPPPVDQTSIRALPERQAEYEILFPNVDGYRIESQEGDITADFSGIENFEIGPNIPTKTMMGTAISDAETELNLKDLRQLRDQQLIFKITQQLLAEQYRDEDGNPQFQKFNKLKAIVEEWYHTKVKPYGDCFKQLLWCYSPEKYLGGIIRAIQAQQKATDVILPILNYYNPVGSTKHAHGLTSKPVFETTASHVNFVVADTESWEQIAAKTLEELAEDGSVISYVKNAFLGFSILYVHEGQDRQYFPDFLVRCRAQDGRTVNLIIEVTGMNKDKAEKKWYVENRWLPAVNTVREKYEMDEWAFIEIANDIRDIKNQLRTKIAGL